MRPAKSVPPAEKAIGTAGLRIPLACQLVAIPLGAAVSYILNREFTWPSAQGEQLEPDITQVQEV